jgi:hypothetical protein
MGFSWAIKVVQGSRAKGFHQQLQWNSQLYSDWTRPMENSNIQGSDTYSKAIRSLVAAITAAETDSLPCPTRVLSRHSASPYRRRAKHTARSLV